MKNPSDIITSSVISLLVKDPRLSLPKRKSFNKVNEQNDEINSYSKSKYIQEIKTEMRNTNLSISDIWNSNYINELNKNKKKTNQINKLRSELLIPGSELTSLENHSKIPILLIQTNKFDYTDASGFVNDMYCGWDLILPRTWAMDFWLPLIHFGSRAIAQNEINYLLFESSI